MIATTPETATKQALLQKVATAVKATNGKFADLIPLDINPQPILYFGDPLTAKMATFGVNPSAKELTWTRWPTANLTVQQLDKELTTYFIREKPKAHHWFAGYERPPNIQGPDKALNLLGHSYRTDTVHLDLSPRATKAMSTIDRPTFLNMVSADLQWFLLTLALCTNVKAAIMSGSVTNAHYFDEFLCKYLPTGYSLKLNMAFAAGRGATTLYTFSGPGFTIPVLFCGSSPSSRNRGAVLASEIQRNLPLLRTARFLD